MAFSLNHKMIVLLIVNIGYAFAATHATPTLLEKVCNKTRDIDFCLNVFGADPATRTASLPMLAQLAIAKATDKAVNTRSNINTRIFFSTDPILKDLLSQCLHAYDGALTALLIAPVDLKKAHYFDLYQHATDAAKGPLRCEHAFIAASIPSHLTRVNVQLGDYCNIIQVIANASYMEE